RNLGKFPDRGQGALRSDLHEWLPGSKWGASLEKSAKSSPPRDRRPRARRPLPLRRFGQSWRFRVHTHWLLQEGKTGNLSAKRGQRGDSAEIGPRQPLSTRDASLLP